jgi:hypothetical protein
VSKWVDIPSPFWCERVSVRPARTGWIQVCVTMLKAHKPIGSEGISRRWLCEWVDDHSQYRTDTTSARAATLAHDGPEDISHEAPAGCVSYLVWLAVE